jgi:hypothetical protein
VKAAQREAHTSDFAICSVEVVEEVAKNTPKLQLHPKHKNWMVSHLRVDDFHIQEPLQLLLA